MFSDAGSRLPRRRLRKESDGSLFDLDERRRIDIAELADDLRGGRFFRAARHSNGADCSHEVLAQLMASAAPSTMLGGGTQSMVGSVFGGLTEVAARLLERSGRRDDERGDRQRGAERRGVEQRRDRQRGGERADRWRDEPDLGAVEDRPEWWKSH